MIVTNLPPIIFLKIYWVAFTIIKLSELSLFATDLECTQKALPNNACPAMFLNIKVEKKSENFELLSFEKTWTPNTSTLQDDPNEWSQCIVFGQVVQN